MPKKNNNTSPKNCSAKDVAANFIKISKSSSVPKPITTGSFLGDQVMYQIPYAGKYIKSYNTGSSVGANIAHAMNAYEKSCGGRKGKK